MRRWRAPRRSSAPAGGLGPYALQAAIAACHARARTADETDWPRIVALYDALVEVAPSPVVELNRAVALAMAFGPAAGLEVVDALRGEPALGGYHLLPSVRGDLLRKLGRYDEARTEFERAAALTRNTREKGLLHAARRRVPDRQRPAQLTIRGSHNRSARSAMVRRDRCNWNNRHACSILPAAHCIA